MPNSCPVLTPMVGATFSVLLTYSNRYPTQHEEGFSWTSTSPDLKPCDYFLWETWRTGRFRKICTRFQKWILSSNEGSISTETLTICISFRSSKTSSETCFNFQTLEVSYNRTEQPAFNTFQSIMKSDCKIIQIKVTSLQKHAVWLDRSKISTRDKLCTQDIHCKLCRWICFLKIQHVSSGLQPKYKDLMCLHRHISCPDQTLAPIWYYEFNINIKNILIGLCILLRVYQSISIETSVLNKCWCKV
jgi:hypothetical protein